ncbi:MAG: MCE family protein, partial [Actinomycetales bacterium]
VKITLAIKPEDIGRIPRDVSAQIIPKTLFGEKFVSLIPDANRGPESLQAGDTITRAKVPIEVEELLNDLYPLLDAVDPANLSYTLSAVAQALDGRGAKLGQTLVKANSYLRDINPEVPQLVDDVIKLGTVSDGYADAMPEIGRLLKNSVTTGNTIVAKRTQLAAFFDEGTRLANTLTRFTKDNGATLEKLASQNADILGISAQYSSAFPCFLGGMATLLPRLDSVFRGNTVHIDLKTLAEQPSAYAEGEAAIVPSFKVINDTVQADPNDYSREKKQATDPDTGGKVTISNPRGLGAVCDDLDTYAKGGDPLNGAIYPGPNPAVYKLVGLASDHNAKFGSADDFDRAAVAALAEAGYYSPSLDAQDSPDQAKV